MLAAAGDATRVRLLQFLLTEEHCTAQCAEQIGVATGELARHLRKLIDAGLLTRRREGGRSYYRVSEPRIVGRILDHAASLAPSPPKSRTSASRGARRQ